MIQEDEEDDVDVVDEDEEFSVSEEDPPKDQTLTALKRLLLAFAGIGIGKSTVFSDKGVLVPVPVEGFCVDKCPIFSDGFPGKCCRENSEKESSTK